MALRHGRVDVERRFFALSVDRLSGEQPRFLAQVWLIAGDAQERTAFAQRSRAILRAEDDAVLARLLDRQGRLAEPLTRLERSLSNDVVCGLAG